jgi:hypothetical protein
MIFVMESIFFSKSIGVVPFTLSLKKTRNNERIQLLQFSLFVYSTIWEESTFEACGVGFKVIQYTRVFIYYTFYVNSRIGLESFNTPCGIITGLYFNFQIIVY